MKIKKYSSYTELLCRIWKDGSWCGG